MYDPTKPYKKQILDLIEQTWETPFVSVTKNVYPIIKKKFDWLEIDHTDGIGTKGLFHWQQRSFKNAVLDALAMNLNDLALVRATPYKLQNHIIVPQDDRKAILAIIESLTQECLKRNIAITGGETSIHNNITGLDLSISVSGFIKNPKPNRFKIGDALVGIKSSGLHSNGFTKVRQVFGNKYRPDFIRPTTIYLDSILKLEKKFDINGMMHITGGAYSKLKDVLINADARLNRNHHLQPQQVFKDLYTKGISDEEMYQTFNCGIGFILSASPPQAAKIASILNTEIIGEVTRGSGKVIIESKLIHIGCVVA